MIRLDRPRGASAPLIPTSRLQRVGCAFGLLMPVLLGLSACAPTPVPPPARPPSPPPAPQPSAPSPQAAAPSARKPAESETEQQWRRALAEHIVAANRERVFDGRPPNPLKAVVVLELTVGADGRLQRATVLRAPEHARNLGAEAVRTAQAASPLPPPPRDLASRGAVRFTETWLFRDDNRFQIRTLALPQLLE